MKERPSKAVIKVVKTQHLPISKRMRKYFVNSFKYCVVFVLIVVLKCDWKRKNIITKYSEEDCFRDYWIWDQLDQRN